VDRFGGAGSVALARAAGERGIPVVVDLEDVNEWTDDLIALASDVVVGEEFALKYTGTTTRREALASLWESGDHTSAVITCGAEGADFATEDGVFHQDAFPMPVVDTTGCGDVFHGAFALCRARGAALRDAVAFSAAAAGLKVRRLGGRAGIPTEGEVRKLLAGGTSG
jgi:sugar/nucleoside kinase (ribokinase family)